MAADIADYVTIRNCYCTNSNPWIYVVFYSWFISYIFNYFGF